MNPIRNVCSATVRLLTLNIQPTDGTKTRVTKIFATVLLNGAFGAAVAFAAISFTVSLVPLAIGASTGAIIGLSLVLLRMRANAPATQTPVSTGTLEPQDYPRFEPRATRIGEPRATCIGEPRAASNDVPEEQSLDDQEDSDPFDVPQQLDPVDVPQQPDPVDVPQQPVPVDVPQQPVPVDVPQQPVPVQTVVVSTSDMPDNLAGQAASSSAPSGIFTAPTVKKSTGLAQKIGMYYDPKTDKFGTKSRNFDLFKNTPQIFLVVPEKDDVKAMMTTLMDGKNLSEIKNPDPHVMAHTWLNFIFGMNCFSGKLGNGFIELGRNNDFNQARTLIGKLIGSKYRVLRNFFRTLDAVVKAEASTGVSARALAEVVAHHLIDLEDPADNGAIVNATQFLIMNQEAIFQWQFRQKKNN